MRPIGLAAALAALCAAPVQAQQITPEGVLGVSVGMTLGEAKAAVKSADWVWEPAFMVDFSGACARIDGEERFCALVYAADAMEDGFEIESLVVESPALATAEGVRVGMPIREVEAIWGDALFSYHTENESREYVSFDDAPRGYSARAALPGSDAFHIGRYADPGGSSYVETRDFPSDAVIGSIWLY